MQTKTALMSLGLGMIAGAVVASVLPKNKQFRSAVTKAADSIESAVEDAKQYVCSC